MPPVVALYASWFFWKQRPHHLADCLARLGWPTHIWSPRAPSAEGPPVPSPHRLHAQYLPPGRFWRVPPVGRLAEALTQRVGRRFFESRADLHVYASLPAHEPAGAPKKLVYDCMDDWAAFPNTSAPLVRRYEDRLCERADRVWAVSRPLRDRLAARHGDKVEYVPNGADCAHFGRALALRGPRTGRPVLGYVGAITSWFDEELVREAAQALPDWDLELIGPVNLEGPRRARLDLPNVHLRGRVPYEDLPARLAAFDVAMIPFKVDDLLVATSPIKLYEYLAAGLPCVSTPMPEVAAHAEPGVVTVAEGGAAFARAAKDLLATGLVARRQAVAATHGWDALFGAALARLGLPVPAAVT